MTRTAQQRAHLNYDSKKRGTAWTAYRPPVDAAKEIRRKIEAIALLHDGVLSAAIVAAIEEYYQRHQREIQITCRHKPTANNGSD